MRNRMLMNLFILKTLLFSIACQADKGYSINEMGIYRLQNEDRLVLNLDKYFIPKNNDTFLSFGSNLGKDDGISFLSSSAPISSQEFVIDANDCDRLESSKVMEDYKFLICKKIESDYVNYYLVKIKYDLKDRETFTKELSAVVYHYSQKNNQGLTQANNPRRDLECKSVHLNCQGQYDLICLDSYSLTSEKNSIKEKSILIFSIDSKFERIKLSLIDRFTQETTKLFGEDIKGFTLNYFKIYNQYACFLGLYALRTKELQSTLKSDGIVLLKKTGDVSYSENKFIKISEFKNLGEINWSKNGSQGPLISIISISEDQIRYLQCEKDYITKEQCPGYFVVSAGIKGKASGMLSNLDYNYSIDLEKPPSLIFSAIGTKEDGMVGALYDQYQHWSLYDYKDVFGPTHAFFTMQKRIFIIPYSAAFSTVDLSTKYADVEHEGVQFKIIGTKLSNHYDTSKNKFLEIKIKSIGIDSCLDHFDSMDYENVVIRFNIERDFDTKPGVLLLGKRNRHTKEYNKLMTFSMMMHTQETRPLACSTVNLKDVGLTRSSSFFGFQRGTVKLFEVGEYDYMVVDATKLPSPPGLQIRVYCNRTSHDFPLKLEKQGAFSEETPLIELQDDEGDLYNEGWHLLPISNRQIKAQDMKVTVSGVPKSLVIYKNEIKLRFIWNLELGSNIEFKYDTIVPLSYNYFLLYTKETLENINQGSYMFLFHCDKISYFETSDCYPTNKNSALYKSEGKILVEAHSSEFILTTTITSSSTKSASNYQTFYDLKDPTRAYSISFSSRLNFGWFSTIGDEDIHVVYSNEDSYIKSKYSILRFDRSRAGELKSGSNIKDFIKVEAKTLYDNCIYGLYFGGKESALGNLVHKRESNEKFGTCDSLERTTDIVRTLSDSPTINVVEFGFTNQVICVIESQVIMWQPSLNKIYSLSVAEIELEKNSDTQFFSSRFTYDLEGMKIKKINKLYCYPEIKVVQLLVEKTDSKIAVVNIRTDFSEDASTRVHSIFDLPHKTTEIKSGLMPSGDFLTFPYTGSKYTNNSIATGVSINSKGPIIYINTDGVDKDLEIKVNVAIGSKSKEVAYKVNIHKANYNPTIKLKDNAKVSELKNGSSVKMNDLFDISGPITDIIPVASFDPAKVQYSPRRKPSGKSLVKGKNGKIDYLESYGEWVLGYTSDADGKLILTREDAKPQKEGYNMMRYPGKDFTPMTSKFSIRKSHIARDSNSTRLTLILGMMRQYYYSSDYNFIEHDGGADSQFTSISGCTPKFTNEFFESIAGVEWQAVKLNDRNMCVIYKNTSTTLLTQCMERTISPINGSPCWNNTDPKTGLNLYKFDSGRIPISNFTVLVKKYTDSNNKEISKVGVYVGFSGVGQSYTTMMVYDEFGETMKDAGDHVRSNINNGGVNTTVTPLLVECIPIQNEKAKHATEDAVPSKDRCVVETLGAKIYVVENTYQEGRLKESSTIAEYLKPNNMIAEKIQLKDDYFGVLYKTDLTNSLLSKSEVEEMHKRSPCGVSILIYKLKTAYIHPFAGFSCKDLGADVPIAGITFTLEGKEGSSVLVSHNAQKNSALLAEYLRQADEQDLVLGFTMGEAEIKLIDKTFDLKNLQFKFLGVQENSVDSPQVGLEKFSDTPKSDPPVVPEDKKTTPVVPDDKKTTPVVPEDKKTTPVVPDDKKTTPVVPDDKKSTPSDPNSSPGISLILWILLILTIIAIGAGVAFYVLKVLKKSNIVSSEYKNVENWKNSTEYGDDNELVL